MRGRALGGFEFSLKGGGRLCGVWAFFSFGEPLGVNLEKCEGVALRWYCCGICRAEMKSTATHRRARIPCILYEVQQIEWLRG